MFRLTLVITLSVFCIYVQAQRQFPQLPVDIDSIFNLSSNKNTIKERSAELIRKVDTVTAELENTYPLYRGLLYMYQAYFMPLQTEREIYHNKGISLIQQHPDRLADTFSLQCWDLAHFYTKSKRREEWLPVDLIFRNSLQSSSKNIVSRFVITQKALAQLRSGNYTIAESLASYELVMFNSSNDSTRDQRTASATNQFIKTKSRFEQWRALPYYKRDEKTSFKADLEEVLRQLDALREDVIEKAPYGSKNFSQNLRGYYYGIFYETATTFADWAINDHREGVAILPLKFFIEQALKDELDPATKASITPVVPAWQLRDVYKKLVQLYINIGNGTEAYKQAADGINYFLDSKIFPEKDRHDAYYELYYLLPQASMVAGKFENALQKVQKLKGFYPLPTRVDTTTKNYWNWYIDVRLTEIDILNAEQHTQQAIDSLQVLLDKLEPIASDSSQMLYDLYQWPHIQYIVLKQRGKDNNWENIRSTMLDALTTLEQTNHWENVPYYYPAQLLYFVAHYRSKGEILQHLLYNMLFYTERNLKESFIMLTPEDRMRLYEQKLSNFFDLYHDLLFSKKLDSFPKIKQKVIAQSLYLKNALADNNMVPIQLFNVDTATVKLVEDIRESRMRINILSAHSKLLGEEEKSDGLKDRSQALWLGVLKYVNTDSLFSAMTWQKISSTLNKDQVYMESVRYTSWLSDSSINYGAYVINAGERLSIIPLFGEEKLMQLLKDPSASPQTGSLNTAGTRGLTIKKIDKPIKKVFKAGDVDKLGEYVLTPLWKHINGKKELLVVPDALLNRISLAALQWQKKDLLNYVLIRQLSGSNTLFQQKAQLPKNASVLLAGGLNYEALPDAKKTLKLFNDNTSWNYLSGTKQEIEKLQPIFSQAGFTPVVLSGNDLKDSSRKMLENYDLIHLATHGFYVDSSAVKNLYAKWTHKEAIRQEPMLRCGIAVSNANAPANGNTETEGHLLGIELANTDLRKCYLISLSACETGLGDLRNNLGVDGLSRALKLGGAKHLLISLWKVPDAPTAVFMQQFYTQLFKGKTPAQSLQATQQFMSKTYPASDWAAFVLVE